MTNILASITVVRDSVHVTLYYYFSKYETFYGDSMTGTLKKTSDVTRCTENTTQSYQNSSSTGQGTLWNTTKKNSALQRKLRSAT